MSAGGVSFTLKIDLGAAQQLGIGAAVREVTDTTRMVFNRANVLTPVDTGRLRAGNQMRVRVAGTQAIGEVFNQTKYAAAVHSGSRAYTVRPRRKKVLKFSIGGQDVYALQAHIPARKGRPWLKRALLEVCQARGYTITTL